MQLENPDGSAAPVDSPDIPQTPIQEEPPPPVADEDQPEEPEPGEPQDPRRGSMLADLIQERTRRQVAEQSVGQSQELIRAVMQAPGGAELLQRISSGQSATPEEDTSELEAIAADLGLLKPDGSMDLDTARRINSRTARSVQQAVQQAVAPLHQQTLQMQAEGAIQHTLVVAQRFGADPAIVERGLRGVPAEQAMNPQVQQATILMALGLQGIAGPGGGAQIPQGGGNAPLVTEAPRGRGQGAARLDPLWRGRLKSAGLSDGEIDGSLRNVDLRRPQKLE
jgi:hypothetical protein